MRIAEAARATLFALLPAAAAGGGLALAPLLGIAGVAAWRPSLILPAARRPPLYLIFLILFIVWMATTFLWSTYENPRQVLRFGAMITTGLIFITAASADDAARRVTLAAAVAGVIVLSILLAVEAVTGMAMAHAIDPGKEDWQIAGNPGRGAAVLMCLTWPMLGLLATRRAWIASVLTLLVAGLIASQFGQSANLVAYACGGVAFALGYVAPRIGVLITTGVLTAWLLLAPVLTPVLARLSLDALPYSWAARVGIWNYVSERIRERPLFGSGLDASRDVTDRLIVQGRESAAVPLHPHSVSLQIWFETGGVGALLAAAALLTGGWALSRAWAKHHAGAAAACGAMAAIGVIANVSFGAWQEWWSAAILIAVAVVSALPRP
jgi:O-antigen ligase